jgi:hypothetical protein
MPARRSAYNKTYIYRPDLMQYLPQYYYNFRDIEQLQEIIAKEIGVQNYLIEDLLNQFFVNTATWGLSLWEQSLGLPVNTSLTYERRREIVKARLRGAGTTTKELIKNVANAYSGGEVEVFEYPKESRFVVQFIGVKGIPPNMGGLINTIENVKPAHLTYSFKYTYTVWLHLKTLTWGQVNIKTWDELKVYEEGGL